MRTPENGFCDIRECVRDQAANILKVRYSAQRHAHDNGDGRPGRRDFVPRHQQPGDDRALSPTPARADSDYNKVDGEEGRPNRGFAGEGCEPGRALRRAGAVLPS